MEDKPPTTPQRISRSEGHRTSIDSSASPGGRSNSSLSSSPGSHVFRMLGKLSKNKKDSLKMPKDGSMSSINTINSGTSASASSNVRAQPLKLMMKKNDEASTFLRNSSVDASFTTTVNQSQTPPRDNTSMPSYNDVDSAFLRAVRGEAGATSSKIEKKASFDDSSYCKGESNYSDADNAFLMAFRGEDKPPAQPLTSSYKEQQTAVELPSVDETNTLPVDEVAHANAAFLGALHASSDTQDDNPKPGGTFVFESKHSTQVSSQSDTNSAFLMAMRQSSSATTRQSSSFGGTGEWAQQADAGGWKSGTLVLNSSKDSIKDKREDESRSFLMSIQAGQASDDIVVAAHKEEVKDESDSEDECDDDSEGLVVPSHPYIEKVMLPRPLFFGHHLPPRIIEEADLAAKMYAKEPDAIKQNWLEKEDEAGQGSSTESAKDADEGSTATKSTISTFSTAIGGGKLFEPSVLPCARNFEGALETFGFGSQNPFHLTQNNAKDDENVDSTLAKEPHPYVSIYSPVFGDRARADRAKSRRKKEQSAHMEDTHAKLLVKSVSNRSYDFADNIHCGSDDGSIEFKDKAKASASTEEANNAFLCQLSSPADDTDDRDFSRDQFSMFARGDSPTVDLPAPTESVPTDLSSRDQFLLFARGDDVGGTFIGSPIIDKKGNTFVCNKSSNVSGTDAGSDADSIEAAEERKAVGLNDNMAAAAAMLAGKEVDIDGDENAHGIGTALCNLAAGGGAKAANKFGRPYSNLELTGGCVPRFSCDDPSLPHESDLGVFETKEDERRMNEYRREKNIIEDMTVPGIMPVVACPTHCTDADDSQSWNTRAAANDADNARKANNTVIISLDGDSNHPTSSRSAPKTSQTYEASRVGWWNLPDGFEEARSAAKKREAKKKAQGNSPTIDIFPANDNPIPLDVTTNLWPSPQVLRDNNLSAAQLHSATSLARFMPHLSDRSPNFRHLQIDTTAVGFPKLGGEVEPLFCKLAIYHFEMTNTSSCADRDIGDSVSSTMSSSGISVSSSSTRDRCGPVTEALNFDVVQDPQVVENCKRALWPYASDCDLDNLPGAIGSQIINDEVILEGSPCGVFPLPSHLHISNLYAVLLVHKVVSDNIDQHPYFKPSRRDKTASSNQKEDIDLVKLRENASKSSDTYGQLVTPIAFGVLPLMQIVGNEESPKVPVTRVVQIPLFKFEQGRGIDVILDHISGMLHSRAVPKVGKIASMTRGHAFLVMRYYGFLGLHSIVSKMKMSRNRLVDFSRELQVKRQGDVNNKDPDKRPDINDPYLVSPWHQQYVVEPASFGGRSISTKPQNSAKKSEGVSESSNENLAAGYAQELAAIPLENSGVEIKTSSRRRSSVSNKFDSMLLHTTLCNELICHPQILKTSKKNVVIKVEMRELHWNDNLKVYAALPSKPSIHNPRRGPWLVSSAFTSCALKSTNPQFLDEFKFKLPLILGDSGRVMALFFSVYQVNIQKRRRLIQTISRQGGNQHERRIDSENVLEHMGSGVLPLSSEENPSCLILNGEHKVEINYRVLNLADSADRAKLLLPPAEKQHGSKNSSSSIGSSVVKHLKSLSWSNEDVVRSFSIDTMSTDDDSMGAQQQELLFESLNYPPGTVFLQRMDDVNAKTHDASDHQSVKSDTELITDHRSVKSEMGVPNLSPELVGMPTSLSSGNLQKLAATSETSVEEMTDKTHTKDDELVLKVNIIAYSSVHPQNKTLADLFMLKPDLPRCVTSGDFSGLSPWGKDRSEILYRLKPERIPPFNFVGGALAETERKLLEPVVSLSKTSKCPAHDVVPHLLRIITSLLRTMTSGIGEPSILWASPDCLIPLRLNAFASLLHVVSSASHYMAKTGLRLLDGDTKWNISALSKTLALLFNEHKLFGGPLENVVKLDEATGNSIKDASRVIPKSLNQKPAMLARSKTSSEPVVTPKPMIIERFSSEESKPQSFDVDAMLQSSKSHQSADTSRILASSKDICLRVDTRNDFMSAMREAAAHDTNDSEENSQLSSHLISSLGSMSSGGASNRRRFFTLPAMATIQESDTEENRSGVMESSFTSQSPNLTDKKRLALDTEMFVRGDRTKPKQFRVPQVTKIDDIGGSSTDGISSFLDSISQPPPKVKEQEINITPTDTNSSESSLKQNTLLANDDDIESAGTAFLDKISKTMETMGFLDTVKPLDGEERRVGAAHHRKTRSRCSIDWTLPPTDMLLEKDQKIEQQNRTKANAATTSIVGFSPVLTPFHDDASSSEDTFGCDSLDGGNEKDDLNSSQTVHPLKKEPKEKRRRSESVFSEPLILPDFADRMNTMQDDGSPQRWWPYVYEVIIYQWLTLLTEQTRKGDGANKAAQIDNSRSKISPIVTKYLSHAAKAARGATIRCAPYLLEIVKQSLSWRIDVVFRDRMKISSTNTASSRRVVPQLVKLDGNMISALEKLITLLTDASIDSRNFDSFEFRKISIDVNDAVVKFIRDLFSMLDVQSVHRLVMVYFSRFVTKEGKHWHDRDSKTTGLRCSWETTKLRLNAVTLFVRFSDFMKVNMPLMEIQDWESITAGKSVVSTRRFYTNVLDKMTRLGISEITSSEGPVSKEPVQIPQMRPHWLAELCTDICLGATGHAEESIQQRASSLLFELFWTVSSIGRARGNISIVASVFVPFVPKVLANVEYLSSLPGKSQFRKDIIPCVLFVLQSAPVGIMRALWRKLAKRAEGKAQQNGSANKYGDIAGYEGDQNEGESMFTDNSLGDNGTNEGEPPDIYDMFGLLNLSLSTIEYDGCEPVNECEENPVWRREFLLSADQEREQIISKMDPRMASLKNGSNECSVDDNAERDTTRNSRRWHAHDCSMVIIHSCRQIVRETLGMLKPSADSEADFNESDHDFKQGGSLSYDELMLLSKSKSSSLDNADSMQVLGSMDGDKRAARKARRLSMETLAFGVPDSVIFVRAATSVYLHALTMRQSDVVVQKTLTAAIEIVKIFGIKVFLNAVGETLQHWIRVTLEHCGARRAEVRVDASEFLNLLLRLTWDSFGSFFRIRLPLLAVQTEVMERIVAKATNKYEKEQKALRLQPIKFSTESAEASLTPLWRTIDRIQFQSASLNLSFKSALARLAIMMKKLFKAYLAVHALNSINHPQESQDVVTSESNPYTQKMRVSVHRIVSNAAGYSRQLVGNQSVTYVDLASIQSETIEDSLLNAADVFSPSELPSHRYAFLEKLAEFHRMRSRFAEEATCRLHIYQTYREAAKQHAHIWSSSPYLPWASSQPEQSRIDEPTGEGVVADIDYENLSVSSGKYFESNPSFRKIFYRAADSVMVRTGDWGGFGGKFLFYGVTLKSEFNSSSPWFTLRQMEDTMADEAELAGDLFLRAGIVESSRYAWNVATYIYSETFNYARLARAYGRLALVVTSKIPVVDTSNQFDMSSQIGRFYRVYFHGGAPDDLLHAQGTEGFVYRVPSSFSIKDFASRLETSIRSILPAKSIIDIVLDDGSPVVPKNLGIKRGSALGGVAGEPIKIKVTPLRPLFKLEDTEKCFRGTPEWFQMKTDEYDEMMEREARGGIVLHQRQISASSGAINTLSSSGSMSMTNRRSSLLSNFRNTRHPQSFSKDFDKDCTASETIGVDRFYFTQPARRDPVRGFRDWLKVPKGSFAERSLRVTELQVEGNFPACVTRQKVIHRAIFTQSPLEAGVEAVSTWCSLLFRTIMATNGLRVLNEVGRHEEGHNIICVAKVLADCIHSSGVKQIGISFLSVNPQLDPSTEPSYYSPYERLSDEEVEKVQTKLARIIVTFLELLHLLIARNRHIILAAVQARKRKGTDAVSTTSGSYEGNGPGSSHKGFQNSPLKYEEGQESDLSNSNLRLGGDMLGKSITTSKSASHKVNGSDRTDAAIGIQSELQRGFISLVRSLSPNLLDAINTEVPRWIRQCCQENYFSSGLYRQADIREFLFILYGHIERKAHGASYCLSTIAIGDELFFSMDSEERGSKDDSSVPVSIGRGHMYQRSGSPSNSLCGTDVSDGKRSDARSRQRDATLGSSYSSSQGYDSKTQGRF